MDTWIVLLRGINVGGTNVLPMRELVRLLESLGLAGVTTYIQSGNALFRTADAVGTGLADTIASAIERGHGFRPRVLLLRAEDVGEALAANPFPEAEAEPKTLHLFFLASAPTAPDLASLAAVRTPSERFHLSDRVFYLHTPDGIGRSKLAARVEKALGVAATARNGRTVRRLWAMANDA